MLVGLQGFERKGWFQYEGMLMHAREEVREKWAKQVGLVLEVRDQPSPAVCTV